MALVSITEAAKLVRRNRSTLYRDIERGRLSKTVTPEGETQIDTAELLRAYGRLYSEEEDVGDEAARNRMRIAILEERTRSLERALQLEAELRKVKDQVTNELRARLADKDNVIKVLESKVLFLEYDKEVEALQPAAKPEAKTKNEAKTGEARGEKVKAEPEPDVEKVEAKLDPKAEKMEAKPQAKPEESKARSETNAERKMPRKGWWARFLGKR